MRTRAFTLVEILVVVIILGILGMMVIPRFASASDSARANSLATTLRVARSQMQLFRLELGVAPGYPGCDPDVAATADTLTDHMTLALNDAGETAAPGTAGYEHGPYMVQFSANPVSDMDTVKILGEGQPMPAAADGTTGWLYKPDAMLFKANCTGTDEGGTAYIDY